MPTGYTTRGSLLARLAATTDERAWEEFCAQYVGLVSRVARRCGLQGADGDDIMQDVLARLVRAMPGFEYDRGRGTFRGYLKTIVRRVISDRIRQSAAGCDVWTFGGDVPGAVVAPDDDLWEAEWRTHHVMQAMRTIEAEFSELDRLAFARYAREGQGAEEVAAALSISIDRVYQAKSRILRRLSGLIARQIEVEG